MSHNQRQRAAGPSSRRSPISPEKDSHPPPPRTGPTVGGRNRPLSGSPLDHCPRDSLRPGPEHIVAITRSSNTAPAQTVLPTIPLLQAPQSSNIASGSGRAAINGSSGVSSSGGASSSSRSSSSTGRSSRTGAHVTQPIPEAQWLAAGINQSHRRPPDAAASRTRESASAKFETTLPLDPRRYPPLPTCWPARQALDPHPLPPLPRPYPPAGPHSGYQSRGPGRRPEVESASTESPKRRQGKDGNNGNGSGSSGRHRSSTSAKPQSSPSSSAASPRAPTQRLERELFASAAASWNPVLPHPPPARRPETQPTPARRRPLQPRTHEPTATSSKSHRQRTEPDMPGAPLRRRSTKLQKQKGGGASSRADLKLGGGGRSREPGSASEEEEKKATRKPKTRKLSNRAASAPENMKHTGRTVITTVNSTTIDHYSAEGDQSHHRSGVHTTVGSAPKIKTTIRGAASPRADDTQGQRREGCTVSSRQRGGAVKGTVDKGTLAKKDAARADVFEESASGESAARGRPRRQSSSLENKTRSLASMGGSGFTGSPERGGKIKTKLKKIIHGSMAWGAK